MKAETAISDLLMKCEEQGVQLPENPWQALREAITALRNTKHHALGYLQIPKAFDQLKSEFPKSADGVTVTTAAASPRVVRRQKRTLMQDMPKRSRRNTILDSYSDSDESSGGQSGLANALSPVASSKKKTKHPKKSRIQEQVEATPAERGENQPLVDQLVLLGEYEMHHGHAQRGISRMRAAKEIRDSRIVITSGAQAKQLDRVGPGVATKIDQLLNEGLAAALSEYDGDGEALPVTK
ncbi:hypothetical protein PHYPSEUDO_010037 [Phytophthora pseudosyringae]|uniref:Crossover junction endonuclease MUS81-like HHH domain-containing protein n=1 Tax=Phytophthora pseudosyringae TaxID=221518 RepID=A0A8T1WBT1_9STRA|nr:hypothetical protein PHYPSEUDO_010037 [Phytophthora pseudosyringae]